MGKKTGKPRISRTFLDLSPVFYADRCDLFKVKFGETDQQSPLIFYKHIQKIGKTALKHP